MAIENVFIIYNMRFMYASRSTRYIFLECVQLDIIRCKYLSIEFSFYIV
ncbi:hypothetical protein YN1HA_4210 [Sulfurisphaera ohwakuensis]